MGDDHARGRIRIYVGASPGVGKTYAMLDEGHRRAARGAHVVIGMVDTRHRPGTEALLGGLEVVPTTEDGALDVDALIALRPAVVLVDDLASSNPPGSARAKRWLDIDVLVAAGLDVISTLNIQQLESLHDVVEETTGIVELETVPDAWVRRADQIELVDMTPEALRRRMAHGNVFPSDGVDAALSNSFRPENLAVLRELALLWVADRVDEEIQEQLAIRGRPTRPGARERVLVAITGAPGNDRVIRRAARMADRVHGDLIGVRVTSAGRPSSRSTDLEPSRRLIDELGGTFLEVAGNNVAQTLISVARLERATQLVVGSSRRSRFEEMRRGSVLSQLLRLASDLDLHVISESSASRGSRPERTESRRVTAIPLRRRAVAWALVIFGVPTLALGLGVIRDDVALSTTLLLTLSFVVTVSAVGGIGPGLVASVLGAVITNYDVVQPTGTLKVGSFDDALALALFVAVGTTVATLVDRVARRSIESLNAQTDSRALARAAATQAGERDPLPSLVDQARELFGVTSISVLQRHDNTWKVLAASGDSPPNTPTEGLSRLLGPDGNTVVAFGDTGPHGHDPELLEAFVDQLSVALTRRRLQEDAAKGEAIAEADALRTGILQAVSHDLRTPLAGIKASVSSLLEPDLTFDAADTELFLHTIDTEADRLDRVIGNLLDMGRVQTGTITAIIRPTALEEVVSAALGNLGLSGGDVTVDVDPTLPLVDIDGALLERALANVVANAVAVQPSGVPVRIDAAQISTAGANWLLLRVVDRGPGIPADDRPAATAPFQRLGDRSSQAGVGLGLAIAAGFSRAIGAELEFDDTPGGGLTVAFHLPLSPSPTVPPAEELPT